MSQYLPEQCLGRALSQRATFKLALHSYRLDQRSKEAAKNGNVRRSQMLRLMAGAYICAGLAIEHERHDSWQKAMELRQDADEKLDAARDLAAGEPTVKQAIA